MTENEAIEVIYDKIETCEFYFAEHDRYPEWCEYEFLEALGIAISTRKEIQRYREMDRKIREVYGDCDGLLEVVIDGLCKHSGIDIGNPIKARLLTDEDVDKWDAYRKIGTVEECREAVEKQTPKKCVEDSCPDHTHYKCPSCGRIQKTKYNDSTFGCILNNCSNCGQALMNENLEGDGR